MSEPLFLKSVMQEKIWGGNRLQEVFQYDIPSNQTGEYWAISAHPNGVSEILNGKYRGSKLDTLYKQCPELFESDGTESFPLLTKIIDANEWLSVQVHPDDQYALQNEGELGKTECWYILSAEEDSEIIYGHCATNKEELSKMIDTQQWDKMLTKVKVKKGDFFYVPSGTVHAIGPGILILETQQSSDTTYRIYDFNRVDASTGKPRELHLEKFIDVVSMELPRIPKMDILKVGDLIHTTLLSEKFFTVYKWQINGKVSFSKFAPYLLISVIEGAGEIGIQDNIYFINKGDHLILPSNVLDWTISGDVECIVSHV